MITPEELRKCAICVFLAAEPESAEDISSHLRKAADTIEQQADLLRQAVEVVRNRKEAAVKAIEQFIHYDLPYHQLLNVFQENAQAFLSGLEKALVACYEVNEPPPNCR